MASGDSLHIFASASGVPPTANFATLTRRNNHILYSFDAAVDESIDYSDVLNRVYSGGGLTVTLIWLGDTAIVGDVVWGIQIERHQDDVTDFDSDDFAALQSVTATVASAAGEPQYSEITFTNGGQMDGLLIGESFRLRVTRDANNVNDTMAGDAQLARIEIRES